MTDKPEGASPISGVPPPAEHRWKPGQSGNPGGRPKGKSITALLRERLEDQHNGKALAAILVESLLKGALKGNLPHIKEVLDRTEGRSPLTGEIEVKGMNDSIFIIHVPGPEVIGREAYDLAIKEVEDNAPSGAKIVVGKWWMRI